MSVIERKNRDETLISLRSQGYTYEAIAYHLYMHGFTEWEISRARVEYMVRRAAPHLCGDIKKILNVSHVINRRELFNADRIRDEANKRKSIPVAGDSSNGIVQINDYRNRGA